MDGVAAAHRQAGGADLAARNRAARRDHEVPGPSGTWSPPPPQSPSSRIRVVSTMIVRRRDSAPNRHCRSPVPGLHWTPPLPHWPPAQEGNNESPCVPP